MTTPKRIGPYQIIKRIAEGGMAEVHLGKSESRFGVSKLVAIKTTLPESSNAEMFKEMFFKEIRVSANLNHQNIVKIYDFGESENRAFMVMEYINGVTLRDLLSYHRDKEEPLETQFVLYIVHQVALALSYAYQSVDPQTGSPLRLIHRDISPHNILISFEGEVKIIDFGIAKGNSEEALTQVGQTKGKVAYMSPEQVSGEPLDNRTDIFSLGIVFWEMLANARFFGGSTVGEVKKSIRMYDVMNLPTAVIKDRSVELLNVLPVMLHHDKRSRAEDAGEVARQIGTLLSTKHPDFSALALADYLKQVFAVTYNDTLEKIRQFVIEDDKTMTISTTTTAEEVMSMLTHKTITDPALALNKIHVPPPPQTKLPGATVSGPSKIKPQISFEGLPRQVSSGPAFKNFVSAAVAVAFLWTAVLMIGKDTPETAPPRIVAQVPLLTPIQPRRVAPLPVLPAPPSPFKKPPTYRVGQKKTVKKNRLPSSTKPVGKKNQPQQRTYRK
ncbi:serine/threonine protein kinase [Bdellovibrio sp. HCB290]|uniref:serine/threonine protein kinase n=1 Tax=Bdellovibrio sp. HCB290 TaxID=3394356 RepID=UPI0039B610A5